MNSGKLDNALNLALQTSLDIRNQSDSLSDGYNSEEDTWELLVKYAGDIDEVAKELSVDIVKLLNQYAIMIIPEQKISALISYWQVLFVEKPYPLIFSSTYGINNSCIQAVQLGSTGLYGEGVLVAIIDSGIDYMHPDFRNDDGTTRIAALWDQTIPGVPPEGYTLGAEFTREQINEAIKTDDRMLRFEKIESLDLSGHGTHVAGIACGNGRASNGENRGVATKSQMLIVKLGSSDNQFIPKTTQLIQGIDYCVRTAIKMKMPLVINLSYGNNYGDHGGNSLLEKYIDDVSDSWKSVIVIGTGNEGTEARHTKAKVEARKSSTVEFAVSATEFSFSMQIWKNYSDDISIEIIAPTGTGSGFVKELLGKQDFVIDNTRILLYYAEPRPINQAQQIYMEFLPVQDTLAIGTWQIRLYGNEIKDGNVNFWLPSGGKLISDTKFLYPSPEMTLTIPSTVRRGISVGAYDAYTDSYANFSGRGSLLEKTLIKPDLVAPGVNVMSAAPNGGYAARTGTSMAAPFVSGAAALLMEWGIVRGNDPYLYGDKVKAYLIKGAQKLPGFTEWPNPQVGWGALCVRDSLPL